MVTDPANAIAVACAANSRYALPLAVMLNSLGEHLASGEADVYVVDDGLTAEDRERVTASAGSQVRVHWTTPPPLPPGLPLWGHMPSTTYQKLTMTGWLPPSVRRVIWLDCDLLILADLSSMWRVNMGTHLLMARQDPTVASVSAMFGVAAHRELGLDGDAGYFNAGVMLIDLDGWRRERIGARSFEYLERFGEKVYFWDQEALNAALAGRWGELDACWNWHPALDRLAQRDAAEPRIVHFSGSRKPWTKFGSGPYHRPYYRQLDRTAWAGWRPPRRWHSGILSWYETSALRRLLYPAEQWGTAAVRRFTREYHRGK